MAEDVRDGGNLHCPYCGRKYGNNEFVDADLLLKIFPGTYAYCETWRCRKCRKQVWVGSELFAFKPNGSKR